MRRVLRLVLMFVAVGYLGLIILALGSDRIIFQPHASSYRDSEFASAMPAVQYIRIPSGNATISAIYLPNPSSKFMLLYSHGNGEDIGDDLPIFEEFRQAGFAVFAYDYRGYGTSTGSPSEKGVYEDVHAAYVYLTQFVGVAPDHIISFGHSLGAAAAIELAATRPVAGLIADAPFVSAFRILTRVQLLPWDKFNNAARIRRVHCPVLVIHGRADEVISYWHGKRIYELANLPKRFVTLDRAGHNDALVVSRQRYLQALSQFATTLASQSPQPAD